MHGCMAQYVDAWGKVDAFNAKMDILINEILIELILINEWIHF